MDKFPIDSHLLILAGRVCIEKHDFDKAINALQRSIEVKVSDPAQWGLLGEAFVAKEDYKEAMNAYQKGLEKFPEIVNFTAMIGVLYYKRGDYNEALEILLKATEKDAADDFVCMCQLGQVYKAKGEFDQLVKVYEKRIEFMPENCALPSRDSTRFKLPLNWCDGCLASSTNVRGYLHRCKSCEDYDLCDFCFNNSPHPHPDHEFLTIPSQEWILERRSKEEVSETYCPSTELI